MAIGNAPWPIGVTMVGIHARTGREKIFSKHVAHVLNDETQRKYIQVRFREGSSTTCTESVIIIAYSYHRPITVIIINNINNTFYILYFNNKQKPTLCPCVGSNP